MQQEEILLDATFSSGAVRYHVVNAVLVCAVTVVLIPALIVVVPLVWILQTIQYRRIRCTLTTRSLKVRRGVLNVVEKTIPLDKITDLALTQGPIMRAMDIERISVETAGQSSMGSSVSLVGIEAGREFRDRVLRQRDIVTSAPAGDHAGPAAAPGAGDTRVLDALATINATLERIEQKIGSS